MIKCFSSERWLIYFEKSKRKEELVIISDGIYNVLSESTHLL